MATVLGILVALVLAMFAFKLAVGVLALVAKVAFVSLVAVGLFGVGKMVLARRR